MAHLGLRTLNLGESFQNNQPIPAKIIMHTEPCMKPFIKPHKHPYKRSVTLNLRSPCSSLEFLPGDHGDWLAASERKTNACLYLVNMVGAQSMNRS